MAQWDITAPAIDNANGLGGTSGNDAITNHPSDIDGATINSVTIIGSPQITSDGTTDDTINIWWWIETDTGTAVYGAPNDVNHLAIGTLGDSVSSASIVKGSSVGPSPSTVVEADWDRVSWQVDYVANMKNDNESASTDSFTIRVDYTPAVVAPVLTNPTESNITQTKATLACTTDTTGGTLYWFVSTSATAPTAADLKAGVGAAHSSAYGNTTSPAVGSPTSFLVELLDPNTTYYAYYIHNDGTSDSNLLESGSWLTEAIATDSETFGLTLDKIRSTEAITTNSETFGLTLDKTTTNTKTAIGVLTYLHQLSFVQESGISFNDALNLVLQVAQQQEAAKFIPLSLNLNNTLEFLFQNVLNTGQTISYDVLFNHIFTNNRETAESIIFDSILSESITGGTNIEGSVNFGKVLSFVGDKNLVASKQLNASITLDTAEQVGKLISEAQTFSYTLSFEADPFGVGILDDPYYGSPDQYIFVDLTNVFSGDLTVRAGSITFVNDLGQLQTVNLIGGAATQLLIELTQLQSVARTTTGAQSFTVLNDIAFVTAQFANFTASLDLSKLQDNQIDALRNIFYSLELAKTGTTVTSIDKSLTVTSNLSLDSINSLLAAADLSLDLTLNELQTFNSDTNKAIEFLSNLNFDFIGDTSVRISYGLQMLATPQVTAILNTTVNLINNMSTVEAKQLETSRAISYLNQLNFQIAYLEGLTGVVDFAITMLQNETKSVTADKVLNYLVTLTQQEDVALTATETLVFAIQLLDVFTTTRTSSLAINFDLLAQQTQTKLLQKLLATTFSKSLELNIQGQTDFNPVLNLSSLLAASFLGDVFGKVSGELTFGLNLTKENFTIGTYVPNIIFDNLLTLIGSAGSDFTGQLDLTVQFNDNYTVNLFKEGFANLNLFYSKLTDTEQILRPSLNFDFQALETSNVNKTTLASTLLDLETSLINFNTKTIPGLVDFALQQSDTTEFGFIADGKITISTELAESATLRSLAQKGITFGHLLGLASLAGAVKDENISFGTIQDFSVDGFVIKFTIVTPDGRIFKVYFEDRLIIVDEEDREIKIYPDFRSNQTIN